MRTGPPCHIGSGQGPSFMGGRQAYVTVTLSDGLAMSMIVGGRLGHGQGGSREACIGAAPEIVLARLTAERETPPNHRRRGCR
jgi:hypothetical protein